MKSRCNNPNYTNFSKWGGKGISYEEKWSTFLGFLEDMGERPEGTSIDRIDNEKGYYKENCRWATKKEQMNNMSSNRIIEFNGVVKNLQTWADELNLDRKTISTRIDRYGWSIEKALTTRPMFTR